jgi:hypothetical protein
MNILAICAASKAVLTSGLAISISSTVRADSLDSFAIWALMSGACFLVITSSRGPWRSLFTRRERAAAAGAHRSPPRWARTGRPRAEVRRGAPRHAAHRGAWRDHLNVRTGRMIWRRRVAFLLPSAFSRSRASSQSPYSA